MSDRQMLTCVFLFTDGRVLVDGSQTADIQIFDVEKDGHLFRTLGRIGGAMLFVEGALSNEEAAALRERGVCLARF